MLRKRCLCETWPFGSGKRAANELNLTFNSRQGIYIKNSNLPKGKQVVFTKLMQDDMKYSVTTKTRVFA